MTEPQTLELTCGCWFQKELYKDFTGRDDYSGEDVKMLSEVIPVAADLAAKVEALLKPCQRTVKGEPVGVVVEVSQVRCLSCRLLCY